MNLVRASSGENFLCGFTHSGEKMSSGCGKCKSVTYEAARTLRVPQPLS